MRLMKNNNMRRRRSIVVVNAPAQYSILLIKYSLSMNLPLFLSRRIYRGERATGKVSLPAIRIATAGVAIGLAVMIITVCVVLGFKHTIRDKVIGFGNHIRVENFLASQGSDQNPVCTNDSLMRALRTIPGIAQAQPYAIAQGVLKTDDDFLGIAFKGIGGAAAATELIPGSHGLAKDEILVSRNTADKLHLKSGDKVFAYFVGDDGVRARRFRVKDIFQTNMSQFDNTICFVSLATAQRLNGWRADQASGVEMLVKDFEHIDDAAENVVKAVNTRQDSDGGTLTSQTVYEAYPQIFSWLGLLDINVWVILALMIAVAGFTMTSGLLIIILERTQMIGTLKALGAGNTLVRRTFLWFAAFIVVHGLLIGDIIGIGFALAQQQWGIVQLDPTSYYVSTAPIELNWPLIAALNVATLLISILVLIIPSYLVAHIHPAKTMKYE